MIMHTGCWIHFQSMVHTYIWQKTYKNLCWLCECFRDQCVMGSNINNNRSLFFVTWMQVFLWTVALELAHYWPNSIKYDYYWNTNSAVTKKPTGWPPNLFSDRFVMAVIQYIWYMIGFIQHHCPCRVHIVVPNNLVPNWYQGICYHHDDLGHLALSGPSNICWSVAGIWEYLFIKVLSKKMLLGDSLIISSGVENSLYDSLQWHQLRYNWTITKPYFYVMDLNCWGPFH